MYILSVPLCSFFKYIKSLFNNMLYGVFLPHSSLWITNYKNELYVFYEILGFNGFIVSYSNDKNNFLQM